MSIVNVSREGARATCQRHAAVADNIACNFVSNPVFVLECGRKPLASSKMLESRKN